jgi:hypothetical protein
VFGPFYITAATTDSTHVVVLDLNDAYSSVADYRARNGGGAQLDANVTYEGADPATVRLVLQGNCDLVDQVAIDEYKQRIVATAKQQLAYAAGEFDDASDSSIL